MGLRGPNARPKEKRESEATSISALWDPKASRINRIIQFIENLPITTNTKGARVGQKFRLRPWQKRIIKGIYGGKGSRKVRTAMISMPRKNGKTGLTATLALAHLCGPEAEPRGQIVSAAAERGQAALIYNEMKAMIDATPALRPRIIARDFNKHLEDVETGSTFQALSSKANTKHGLSPTCVIYDELAQARDRELYDALATATGAREQPLMIVISTQSPDPNHVMSQLVDYGLEIQQGSIRDESFFAYVQAAPTDADPWDEQVWHACNPALGDFRSLEEMRTFAQQAQRIPAKEASFRLFYLNQRVSAEARFVPRADWDACQKQFDPNMLHGRECYAALDLSGSGHNDLTAMILNFPIGEHRVILPFFWACADGLAEAEKRDHVPYQLWAKQRFLHTIPGSVMDYSVIARKLGELTRLYKIRCAAFDRYKIDLFIKACNDEGVTLDMRPHGQGFKDMDPSIQVLENDILSWRLQHDGNPILTWNMEMVAVESDAAGNRKFNKKRSTGRIDGAVALAMSAGLVGRSSEPEPQFFVLGAKS